MCSGGKGSQSTNSSSTYTPNPQVGNAVSGLLGAAQNTANTPYNPATATTIAGMTPQQQQAFNEIGGLQGAYQPTMNQAQSLIQQGGSPISGSAISNYENPYQQDVVNSTMAQLGQMDATQQQGVLGNSASMGALGGSRTGVTQAALAGQQQMSNASTLAGLNSSNYSQALGAAQADRTAAGNAGNSMANLGAMNQNLGLESASALYGAGSAQQQQQQNVNNAASSNAQSQTMWPYQNEQWLAGLLGGLGPLMGGTTNGNSTTTQNPGLGGILGGLMMGASGLKDGGAARRANGGGFDFSNYVPLSALSPAHPNEPALISAPAAKSSQPSMADWSKMGKGLGNLDKGLFGTSTSPTSSNGGWETSTQTDGLLGSGGLGSMLGFADGGDTSSFWDAPPGPPPMYDASSLEKQFAGNAAKGPSLDTGQQLVNFLSAGAGDGLKYLPDGKPVQNFGDESAGIDLSARPSTPPAGLGATQPVTSAPTGGLGATPPPALPDEATPVKSETYPGISRAPAAPEEPATGISDNGVDFIKNQEAFSSKPYSDYHQTSIGYGTKAQPGETSIDRETAEARLRDETGKIGAFIQSNAKIPLTQNQYDALTSFGYNTGTGPLKKVIDDINGGKTDDAIARMQRYTKAGGETSDDLIKRRAAEVAMFSGDNGAEPGARITPAMHQASEARIAAADNKSTVPADQQGGLLYKLFGVNPLGLTSKDRQILFSAGAGTLAGGPYLGQAIGRGGLQAMQTSQALDQQSLNARVEAQKLALEAEKIRRPEFKQTGVDAMGRASYGFVDPYRQTVTPASGGASGASSNVPLVGEDGQKLIGQAYTDALPIERGKRAWNIVSGNEKMPAATRGDPTALQIQQDVRNADPTFNANRYDYMRSWEDPNKQIGKTRIANATAISHAGHLSDLIPNLPDHSLNVMNRASNWWASETNDPGLAEWKANAQPLADEITKVMTGSAGSLADREAVLKTLDPSQGRAALNATLKKYTELFAGKTDALVADWKKNMGPYAKDPEVLSEDNKADLEKLKSRYIGNNSRSQPAQQAPVSPGARPVGVSSVELQRRAATIPDGAKQMLKQNPTLGAQFDAKYGAGSASAVLGG